MIEEDDVSLFRISMFGKAQSRSQDGDMIVEVLESVGYRTSSSSWPRGARRCACHPPDYMTGTAEGREHAAHALWTKSAEPRSPAKGKGASLLREMVEVQREPQLRAVQGWLLGWKTCVRVWGGGGCVERVGCKCVSVYRSPIFGCDISLSKDKVAF